MSSKHAVSQDAAEATLGSLCVVRVICECPGFSLTLLTDFLSVGGRFKSPPPPAAAWRTARGGGMSGGQERQVPRTRVGGAGEAESWMALRRMDKQELVREDA